MKKHLLIVLFLAAALVLSALGVPAEDGSSISGTVFLDSDGDGMPDGAVLPGTGISLIRRDGASTTVIGSTTAGADGAYAFSALPDGVYFLQVSLDRKLVPTLPSGNGSRLIPASGSECRTVDFDIKGGAAIRADLGATKVNNYIRLTAFGDENANGGRFSNEPLLPNVPVDLLYEMDGVQYVVASAVTDKKGEATIRGVTPGVYRVSVTLPDPYIIGPMGEKLNSFWNCILPTDSATGASNPITMPQKGSIGIAAGGVKTGKIAGRLWLDQDGNGRMDPSEGGREGVVLTLRHNTLGVERTLTTGSDTGFLFDKLQPGDYTLTATLPDDLMFTLPGTSIFANPVKAADSVQVNVQVDGVQQLSPIGVTGLTGLTVRAFHDENVNGLWDADEKPFAGAKLDLVWNGQAVVSGETDAAGNAVFSRVPAGSLTIRATLPEGQIFSVPAEDGSLFATASAKSQAEASVDIASGSHEEKLLGITLPAAISGMVFHDANLNGVMDADETPVAGLPVEAVTEGGDVAASAATDEAGAYQLDRLIPGMYRVRFRAESPYIFSDPAFTGAAHENKVARQTPEYGETEPLTVAPAEACDKIDAAVFRSGIINGRVLIGDDSIGFDGTLGGVPGAAITLLTEDGHAVSEHTVATTDETGSFSLKGALPGRYRLAIRLPEGYAFTRPMQNEQELRTDPITVESSDTVSLDPCFGVKLATLSGTAFLDQNGSGRMEEDEKPLEGIQISLTAADGSALSAATGVDGAYAFQGLRPGAYTYTAALPDDMLIGFSEQSVVKPAFESTASETITVSMGETRADASIAAVPRTTLQIRTYYDRDLSNGVSQDDSAASGLTVTLAHKLTGLTVEAVTDSMGSCHTAPIFAGEYEYSLTLPENTAISSPQGVSQSGQVWTGSVSITAPSALLDLGLTEYGSISGTVWNIDGSTENAANVPLTLKNTATGETRQAATDADGSYRFDRLLPGEYVLGATIANGFRFARTLDTRVRPSVITQDGTGAMGETGQSAPIRLAMGAALDAQDIGMGATGRLGDFAWLDLNGNGMQDDGEPGVPGLKLELYQYGELTAAAETDAYGRFLFSDIYPGTYTLKVTMPAELRTTKHQTEFKLVASVLPAGQEGTAAAENIVVPSRGRNLACDLGFVLKSPGRFPASMQHLPRKDWTPLVDVTPTR